MNDTLIRGTQFIKKDLVKNKFALVFSKTKEFSLNVQQTALPSITVPSVKTDNPFIDKPLVGTKPQYSQLVATFVVDDVINSYGMINDWLRSFAPIDMTFDDSNQPRKEFDSFRRELPDVYEYSPTKQNGSNDYYDEATLIVNNSSGIPELEVRFFDIFPVALSELPLDITAETDDQVLCTAAFEFWYYTIHRKGEI